MYKKDLKKVTIAETDSESSATFKVSGRFKITSFSIFRI